MSVWEILLIVACVVFVSAVVIARIVAKKKGKTCDCGCSECSSCKCCQQAKELAELRKKRKEDAAK